MFRLIVTTQSIFIMALWVSLSAIFYPTPTQAQPESGETDHLQQQIDALIEEVETLKDSSVGGGEGHAAPGARIGGYGEMHLNIQEGSGKDLIDLHRVVLYMGYGLADWIQFHSELEIEHAFIHREDGGGEVIFEQAYLEFMLGDALNIRAGRMLAPLGIINQIHEPPTFHGVERPSFNKYILPSTWSLDGVGLAGALGDFAKYELDLTNGLDASGFSAKNGLRGGRMHERPGVSQPALSGRIDLFPGSGARLGASFFAGGADNANKGSNPDLDVHVLLAAADFDWSLWRIDLRGEWAYGTIDGAENVVKLDETGNASPVGVAEAIMGWYLEAALRIWPDVFKTGRLADSELAIFARYDDLDTQYAMPSGVSADPAGDRSEITIGLTFHPVPQVAIKMDAQFPDDATNKELADRFNMGVGWAF